MIRENPFLGPKWVRVGEAIVYLLDHLNSVNTFYIQTYMQKFRQNPETSPYVQGLLEADGSLHVEVSGNVQVRPKLTDYQYDSLEFYGWEKPESTSEEYKQHHQGIPNFYRLFENDVPKLHIAEFLLTSLVGVYGMTELDFLNFGSQGDKVAEFKLLGRLKVSDTNPFGDIFALPGHHLDRIDGNETSNGGK